MKSGKRETTEEIQQLNQDNIRTLGVKENYKYFDNIENGHHQTEMKVK